jgi:hypothetical protein
MEQQYRKITFDFPEDEYVFLKMACAKQRISMKEFLTTAVIKSIDEYEANLDSLAYKEVTDEERANARPWEDVQKELGWDKLG